MTVFRFDESKGFDDNLEAFLDHMASKDPDMAAIFRVHVAKLKGLSDDARRRAARSEFNVRVKSSLDELLASSEKEVSS